MRVAVYGVGCPFWNDGLDTAETLDGFLVVDQETTLIVLVCALLLKECKDVVGVSKLRWSAHVSSSLRTIIMALYTL